ncbi:MAG: hypothetical protein P1U87_16085 [Verrucomicrobiales bacterium]|nr:hypothetical protein [Verrucomicrobiales bacterium]
MDRFVQRHRLIRKRSLRASGKEKGKQKSCEQTQSTGAPNPGDIEDTAARSRISAV